MFLLCFFGWQVGVLLEHTVGNLDPLYIVNIVPNGLEIPRLVLNYNHCFVFLVAQSLVS